VGGYLDSIGLHSLLLSRGRFTSIDVPAAFGIGTQAFGISRRGSIVGTYFDGSGKTHGFLLSMEPSQTEWQILLERHCCCSNI
jgi:hypothetical protein